MNFAACVFGNIPKAQKSSISPIYIIANLTEPCLRNFVPEVFGNVLMAQNLVSLSNIANLVEPWFMKPSL